MFLLVPGMFLCFIRAEQAMYSLGIWICTIPGFPLPTQFPFPVLAADI